MKKKLRIYERLILIFFSAIITIYLMTLGVYCYSIRNINKNIEEKIILNTESIAEYMGSHINNIEQFSSKLLQNYKLKYIDQMSSVENKYEYYRNINEIIEKLKDFKLFNEYIVDVKIYFKQKELIISANNNIIHKGDKLYDDYILNLDPIYRRALQGYNNKLIFFDYLAPYYIIDDMNDADIIVFTELNTGLINRYLKNSVINDNSMVFITDDNYNLLSDLGMEEELAKYKDVDTNSFRKVKDNRNIFKLSEQYISFEQQINGFGKLIVISEISGYNKSIKILNIIFLIVSLLAIIISIFYAFTIDNMIHKPLQKFIKAFKQLESESYNIKLETIEIDEFRYLYEGFNSMVNKIKEAIAMQYEQKMALQESELKQLQLQINPHFLYNGFYNIQRMCSAGEYDTVSLLSKRLATYYQYITRNGVEEVPFYMELKHTQDYIDIQHIRFRERIVVSINYDDKDIEDFIVPRLILQPIVENIYEHAFDTTEEQGKIDINISRVDDNLIIIIEDDGQGMSNDKLNSMNSQLLQCTGYVEHTGILNVNKRLKIKHGSESGIHLEEKENGGIRVEIIICYKERVDNV